MNNVTAGIAVTGLLFVLLFAGVPVAFAMAMAGFIGLVIVSGVEPALELLGSLPYGETASWTFTIIPLFVLMGGFAYQSGVTKEIFAMAHKWLGHLPGGLAISTVMGCAGFGFACGSSVAAAAMMSRIAVPEMEKLNYSRQLSLGSVAAGGTLAILIPPSVTMVLYGLITEVSIGRLFIAGIIPGILTAFIYSGLILLLVLKNPKIGGQTVRGITWKERLVSLRGVWGIIFLGGAVLGAIFTGVATPTEAAAVGTFIAFLMVVGARKLSLGNLRAALLETGRTTVMIFAIMFCAMIFARFLAIAGVPTALAEASAKLALPLYVKLAIITLIYVIMGMFVDPMGILLLTVPILFPVVVKMGIDPIWFGVFIVKMVEISMISPPYGLNLFVMQGAYPQVSVREIYRGVIPFCVVDLLNVVLWVMFPQIVLWLPSIMIGPG